MPARRSRTQHWRRGLEQIQERGGALEIAVKRDFDGSDEGAHLVWRVGLLGLRDDELVVEQPTTLGTALPVGEGVELIAVMTIGQNRWTFPTRCLGNEVMQLSPRRVVRGLRLAMPEGVERCSRRTFDRFGTAQLHLPTLEVWPLLDPASAVLAERACAMPAKDRATVGTIARPEVGPSFPATMLNIGGGGIGVRVDAEHAGPLGRHRLLFLRFALPPEQRDPICATAKIAHTHVQPDQTIYAGLSFEFAWNPDHQGFLVDRIGRFVAAQQTAQRAAGAARRSA